MPGRSDNSSPAPPCARRTHNPVARDPTLIESLDY